MDRGLGVMAFGGSKPFHIKLLVRTYIHMRLDRCSVRSRVGVGSQQIELWPSARVEDASVLAASHVFRMSSASQRWWMVTDLIIRANDECSFRAAVHVNKPVRWPVCVDAMMA